MNIGNNFGAREFYFGWYLMGSEHSTEVQSFHTLVYPSHDLGLQEQLKQFWEIEEAEKTKLKSKSNSDFFVKTFLSVQLLGNLMDATLYDSHLKSNIRMKYFWVRRETWHLHHITGWRTH